MPARRNPRPGDGVPVAPDRHQPGGQQELADAQARAHRRHRRNISGDDLFLPPRDVPQCQKIDLDDPADGREGFGRHDGQGARNVLEIAGPDVDEIGKVVDVLDVDLRLQRLGERGAGGVQHRRQFLADQEFGLFAALDAAPAGVVGDVRGGVEGAVAAARHLSGDEDEIIADDGRGIARPARAR
jgi:hypothetical protein